MPTTLTLDELRNHWNAVLDLVESKDRVVWIAFFDARLAHLENGVLTLDFSDARKFGTVHEYTDARARHTQMLQSAISEVTGANLEIEELS